MKVIDALKLIEIDVAQHKSNALGNALLAELYWANQRINFEKDTSELTDEEYHAIAKVYIIHTINKKDKKYGYYDLVDEMKSILDEKIAENQSN